MDSVVSKIQETGQHTAKKTDALFARTRDAGEAFLDEVRGAGKDLVVFVRTEAKGWRRFLTQRTSQLKVEARGLFAVPAVERRLLAQVDGALRAIDSEGPRAAHGSSSRSEAHGSTESRLDESRRARSRARRSRRRRRRRSRR